MNSERQAGPPEFSHEQEMTGSLQEFPLGDLLRFLANAGRTGCLEVGAGPDGHVWLHRGRIYFAHLGPGHHLIDIFRRARAITEAQALEVSATGGLLAPGSGARLMNEARDGGDRLRHAVLDLAVDTVFQLLAAPGVSFVFRPDTLHPFGPVLTYEIETILDDAARRLEEWKLIADELPATNSVLTMPLELPESVVGAALTRDEWTVLAACDGRRDLGEVMTITGLRPLDVMRLTHHLVRSGRLV
ncbi:MAG: DUF4388 domain-containing protein [Actinomycetia bacterium]|nr:DUF4388 domain-containing protein [Actinomycetes bacterium]MCP4087226.1 DUF4388 domain-containing protein [Actinomycetes bacterium]